MTIRWPISLMLLVVLSPALAADSVSFPVKVTLSPSFSSPDRVQREATEAIDAAVRSLEHQFGAIPTAGDKPRSGELVIYRRVDDFKQAIRKIGAARFEENLAVVDYDRRSAHVALQPTHTADLFGTHGLPLLTRQLIAHEVAHLWCDTRWPKEYRASPRWLREGLVTWAAEDALRSCRWIDDVDADALLSTRLVAARQAAYSLSDSTAPSATADPFASFESSTMYALDWAWCRFKFDTLPLRADEPRIPATRRMSFADLMVAMSAQSNQDVQAFRKWLNDRRPQWNENARSLEVRGGDWFQMAFIDSDALAWRTRGPASTPYIIRGNLTMVGRPDGQAGVLFARDATGYLAVSFRTFTGVAISRYDERSGAWRELARDTSCDLSAGRVAMFVIRVSDDRVTLDVDGRRACDALVEDKRMTGPWGLMVHADSAVEWSNLRVDGDKP